MASPAPIAGNGRPNVTVEYPAARDVSPTARHVTSISGVLFSDWAFDPDLVT